MRLNWEDSPVRAKLDRYRAEREDLLQRLSAILEQDDRIVAAWLFGSLGRGEEDDLSDLDLWAVVSDSEIDAVAAQRQSYVAQAGEPLLVLEAPQNAPRGGAYLMALYDGESGAHQVDWYWQAQSAASIPQQTRLLFDRVGLPSQETPTQFGATDPLPERTPLEAACQAVAFFWVMILITAKYAARSPREERMGLLPLVTNPLREVERFLDEELSPEAETLPAHPQPQTKLALLRRLAARMQAILPRVAAQGGAIPERIPPVAS